MLSRNDSLNGGSGCGTGTNKHAKNMKSRLSNMETSAPRNMKNLSEQTPGVGEGDKQLADSSGVVPQSIDMTADAGAADKSAGAAEASGASNGGEPVADA